jgi:type II secretory pathway component PulF
MTVAEKALLYRELAKMTAADFHFDRSIKLLLSHQPNAARRAFLEAVQARLAAGGSVAEAVASASARQVTPLERAMVEAGERSGRLADSFAHLAAYFEAAENARRQSWRAMHYPLILLHLAILLPELPRAIASGTPAESGQRVAWAVALLWVAVGLGLWGWRHLSRLAERSPWLDALLGRVPFAGRARRHWALARFAQVFHSGLLAALRMSRAVELAGDASQSGRLRAATRQAASRIEGGDSVAAALRPSGAFPRSFVDTIATAEEVGSLDEEMGRWTLLQTEEAMDALRRASLWLPKVAYAIITVFVVYRIYEMAAGFYGGLLQINL